MKRRNSIKIAHEFLKDLKVRLAVNSSMFFSNRSVRYMIW
jgi:hypothetical protein